MYPAELLLLNIIATLRSRFGSSLSKCLVVYPDTERSEVEGSHSCTATILFDKIVWSSQHPTSSIQDPVSSIQYPVSSIQYRASSIQYRASSIQYRASSIQTPKYHK